LLLNVCWPWNAFPFPAAADHPTKQEAIPRLLIPFLPRINTPGRLAAYRADGNVMREPILKTYINEAIEVEKAGLKVNF
jgi:uncharacterized protein YdeI (YjbR/CyaY-like superfamily)